MSVFSVKARLHDESILKIISHSQYMPTSEKLNALADSYEADDSIFVLAHGEQEIDGVIIIKHIANGEFEIVSIATSPFFRGRGIASKLISYAVSFLKCSSVKAETDDDAVGFYRKYGFEIEELGEKYPGYPRYLCTLQIS